MGVVEEVGGGEVGSEMIDIRFARRGVIPSL